VAAPWPTSTIARMFSPETVTIVGGSPNNGASLRLIENLHHADCQFAGTIHVVNRRRAVVKGIQSVESIDEIDGGLGLVYLMLGTDASLRWLDSLGGRAIDGIVLYSGGFAEVKNAEGERALRQWAATHQVPILGPQSLGLINPAAGFMGMCANIPESIRPGEAAALCQSGGLAAATARVLLQRGLGVGPVASYGNGSVLSFLDLAHALIEEEHVRCLLIHTEAVPDVRSLRSLGRRAHQLGKAVVLTLAGVSEIGRRTAVSHTASVATPQRLAQGVCEQAGIIWADDVDELLDSAEALLQSGLPERPARGVGIFAGSGGGAIAIADAMAAVGVDLPQPSAETVDRLRELGMSGAISNPLDVGAGLLDDPETYEKQLAAYIADPNFGVLCKVIGSSAPTRAMPAQFAQFEDFVRIVQKHGKVPFLATPVSQAVGDVVQWEGTPWGAGARRVAVKLRALQAWASFRAVPEDEQPWWQDVDEPAPVGGDAAPTEHSELLHILTGPRVLAQLPPLPMALPPTVLIDNESDMEAWLAAPDLPVVLKSEIGLEHRAAVGAVIGPLRNQAAADPAVRLIAARWGFPISVNGFVPHSVEFMVGVEVLEGFGLVSSVGPGGVGAGSQLHLFSGPLSRQECAEQIHRALGIRDDAIASLLHALQDLPTRIPHFRSLEFNPVVVDGSGQLVALDAKLVVDAPEAATVPA
jgi:acyl-CoA synthetase (NDP forming)